MAFLEVEHLKYRYPHTKKLALDDISFTAEKGEFIGIIGENGAGKSTLSQVFCGLVPQFYKGAYGGKVTVDGIAAATTPTAELCKKVGLIFQNPFNQLSGAKDTVWDEVAFGLENFGVPLLFLPWNRRFCFLTSRHPSWIHREVKRFSIQ